MLRNIKSQLVTIALAGLTVALPTVSPPTTTTLHPSLTSTSAPAITTWCAQIRLGPQIIAITPGTAVTGLQLTNPNRSGRVTLTSNGYATAISYTYNGLGFFDNCHEWWLNIGTSSNTWKPLSFGFDIEQTFSWVITSGNILTASGGPSYSAASWFIACQEAGSWVLYLQTGLGEPDGETCVRTQLQIAGAALSGTLGPSTTTTTPSPTTSTSKPPATTSTTI